MKNACMPLAEIQPRVGAEVVPVMTPRGVVHGPSRTQWISWRNTHQRVCADVVDLQDRVILPGKVAAWSHDQVSWSSGDSRKPVAEPQLTSRRRGCNQGLDETPGEILGQRVRAKGVELQDRVVLSGKIAAWCRDRVSCFVGEFI